MLNAQNDSNYYLQKYWGHHAFRPLQKEIIQSACNNNDTLALLPTGGGKSICFQIPALMKEGLCIVVSPLISLMKDQVANLNKKNIAAAAITSLLNQKEIEQIINAAFENQIKFLYVSPERLLNEVFKEQMANLNVNYIVVDEAHCISQWGHDFRPSYLKISELKNLFPKAPIIALTASATKEVIEEIKEKLEIPKCNLFRKSFERKNLNYIVLFEENKYDRLFKIINTINGSGIIYVRNRKRTESISRWLNENKMNATHYHAGMTIQLRQTAQQKWLNDEVQLMVATNAFGMGIDKPNVRFVVHLDLPENIEAYFQEAGRAGRDELNAYSIVLTTKKDILDVQSFCKTKIPTQAQINQVYQAICNYFQIAVDSGNGFVSHIDLYEISKAYQISTSIIFNAIKCLEREGYFQFLETHYEPSKIQVNFNKEQLYNFQLKNQSYDFLIKTILRSYGGVFNQPVTIKEKDLAYRCKISEFELIQKLFFLHKQKIILYEAQTGLPKLVFLHNRQNIKIEPLQLHNYKNLSATVNAKLASMVHYIESKHICRSRLLLAYFNETDYQNCNVCDVCLNNKKKSSAHYLELKNKIISLVSQDSLTIDNVIQSIYSKPNTIVEIINHLIDDEVLIINEQNQLEIKK